MQRFRIEVGRVENAGAEEGEQGPGESGPEPDTNTARDEKKREEKEKEKPRPKPNAMEVRKMVWRYYDQITGLYQYWDNEFNTRPKIDGKGLRFRGFVDF